MSRTPARGLSNQETSRLSTSGSLPLIKRFAILGGIAVLLALAALVLLDPLWLVAKPSHIVVVIMENRGFQQVSGAPDAPYINDLARRGALFTQSFAITHPSQPNYLALFSGSTHGVYDNRCPLTIHADTLAQQLFRANKTFVGYSEGLPAVGFDGCEAPGGYVRKHAPWANFPDVPRAAHQPFSAFPTADFAQLPTVSIVVPNLENDMHDGSLAQADQWLKSNLDAYVQWSADHNGLLILTWDEDDLRHQNQIPTVFYGPMVRSTRYSTRVTHYDVLRTMEALLGLSYVGEAGSARTITQIWRRWPF